MLKPTYRSLSHVHERNPIGINGVCCVFPRNQGAHSMVCGTGSRGDPRKIKVELDAAMLYVSSGQLIKSIDLLSHLLHLHQSRIQVNLKHTAFQQY